MRHKRKIFTLILLVGLFGAGVAFAAWSSTGSGSATAQATTAVNSVIAAGSSPADLYPGAVMTTATVTISNPNPYPVLVNSISAGSSSALTTPTCAAASVTSDVRTDVGGTGLFQSNGSTKTIAAGGSGTYLLTTRMIANPTDGCQTRTFTLPLTATLSSNA